ncbi:hypothetical protein KUV85_15250 [Nocardioides panacisoli]|uniref:hypothetical protein n=1 Tax=Nocardioides panacisoli TaxID=627624 RepID=UPI001C635679|nr:hypothetical protein [Nocardioides panacisoli]QYJ03671.1 hypothetical protein KUV85_15250 [Nocardioides panacisoli]
MSPDGGRPSPGPGVRLGFGALLVAVAVLVLLVRPDPVRTRDAPPDTTASPTVVPTAAPARAPDEATFCAAHREWVAARERHAEDDDRREPLREEADRMVTLGVPDAMSTLAVGGLYAELAATYAALGLVLSESAVPGGVEASTLDGADAAYDAYVRTACR